MKHTILCCVLHRIVFETPALFPMQTILRSKAPTVEVTARRDKAKPVIDCFSFLTAT